jgi:hypothetical protein
MIHGPTYIKHALQRFFLLNFLSNLFTLTGYENEGRKVYGYLSFIKCVERAGERERGCQEASAGKDHFIHLRLSPS